jgi:hypothetical protein
MARMDSLAFHTTLLVESFDGLGTYSNFHPATLFTNTSLSCHCSSLSSFFSEWTSNPSIESRNSEYTLKVTALVKFVFRSGGLDC